MRNAALVLGLIGGVIAMIIGFFGYGYTQVIEQHGEIEGIAAQVQNIQFFRAASFLAPLLAIAGAAMAKVRALWGGGLMLIAGGLLYAAYGFTVFTMFPVDFLLLGGLLALAARRPDEERAH